MAKLRSVHRLTDRTDKLIKMRHLTTQECLYYLHMIYIIHNICDLHVSVIKVERFLIKNTYCMKDCCKCKFM